MATGNYSLPCIRGRQGDSEYYLIQCSARLLPRLFLFNEDEVPLSLRRGRVLDAARVAEIVRHLSPNLQSYTMAPLLASVDCEVNFESLRNDSPDLGYLQIPITARLILNDGQHRRAALQQLLHKGTPIDDDTIPIMLIPDPHLERSAGLYTEFNRYRLQSTLSKRILHDGGDLAILIRQLADEIPVFQGRTELEKTTISNRSTALFTISAVYQATEALLGINKKAELSPGQVAIAQRFWQELGEIIPEWQRVINREVAAAYLRQHYVHSHTVTLLAIGMAGHDLLAAHPKDWGDRLRALGQLDWSKENTNLWEGRAMVRGKMSKSHDSIRLTAIAIKRSLGLTLSEQEQALEQRLLGS
ncbi:MAG: DNA sulfur modification protein DndB [Roseiflexaceae bacterium]